MSAPGNVSISGIASANGKFNSSAQGGGGSVLFSDDFTSYTLDSQMGAAGNANFGWKVDQTGFSHVRAFGRPGGSSRSVEFAGTTTNDSQLGFLFTSPQTQAFFRYYVYYPSGAESPTRGPAWKRTSTASPNNNKFIRFSDGSDWNTQGTFRFGASTFGNADGNERLQIEIPGPGYYMSPGVSSTWPQQSLANNSSGVWKKIEMQIKMNTTTPTGDADGGHGLADGIYKVWIDDTLVMNFTNVGMAPAGSSFQQGYLFGAQNNAMDNANSLCYITDFAVSLTGRV